MSVAILLVFLSSLLSANADYRVMGGVAADKGEFPWLISIQLSYLSWDEGHLCAGSLIEDGWVLTAANCIENQEIDHIIVIAGAHNLDQHDGSESIHSAVAFYIHPDYDSETERNDLALIQLGTPVRTSAYRKTVKVSSVPLANNVIALVAGWGEAADYEGFSSKIMKGSVFTSSWEKCQETLQYVEEGTICAGDPKGKTSICWGDIGGPLMYGDTLVGVASYHHDCVPDETKEMDLFTDVGFYKNWIDTTINNN